MQHSRTFLSYAAVAACVALLAAPVAAQRSTTQRSQGQRSANQQAQGNTLTFPGGEPVIEMTANAPQEVRAGQSFDFQIQVRNVSDNVAIHDLVIARHGSEQFEIQSARIESGQSQGQAQQRNQRNQGQRQQQNQNQPQQEQEQQNQDEQDQQQQEQQQQQQQQQGQAQQEQQQTQQAQDNSRWTIEKLLPGESRTIHLTAISNQEGASQVCLTVESYKPALCLSTRFTKPELEIVKRAPERVDICQIIEYEYLVKNSGTGDLEKFTVEDSLPEGLKTVEGHDHLRFTLDDGLKAGDTRKFVASLRASRPGEYASRAEVRGPEGVSASSNRTTTQVVKPELAVSIEGPSTREINSLANYTVRVTNHGDSPAPSTALAIFYPRSADIVRVSQPRSSSRAADPNTQSSQQAERQHAQHQAQQNAQRQSAQQQNAQRENAQRQKAQQQNQNAANQKRSQQRSQAAGQQPGSQQDRQGMARRQWSLGNLEPGETREVTYALRPFEGGELQQIAVAEYVCEAARDQDSSQAVARDKFRVEDTLLTEIIALPGLRLTVVDDKDPVPTGENVTYTIKVANEGTAEATDVQVSAMLPENLEFVSARGDTEAKNSQGEVSFETIPTLAPGESSTWQVVVKVNEQAEKPIQVELTAADIKQKVNAEEPTTFFSQDDVQPKQRGQKQQPGQKQRQQQDQQQQQEQEQQQQEQQKKQQQERQKKQPQDQDENQAQNPEPNQDE